MNTIRNQPEKIFETNQILFVNDVDFSEIAHKTNRRGNNGKPQLTNFDYCLFLGQWDKDMYEDIRKNPQNYRQDLSELLD